MKFNHCCPLRKKYIWPPPGKSPIAPPLEKILPTPMIGNDKEAIYQRLPLQKFHQQVDVENLELYK